MDYRAFVDHVKACATEVGESFTEPEEDWEPIALLQDADSHTTIVLLDLPKELRPQAIVRMILELKARKVATVYSSWMRVVEPEEVDTYEAETDPGYVANHPDRKEILLVTVSDAERTESWMADIERTDDAPPALGVWTCVGINENITGAQVDSIKKALR